MKHLILVFIFLGFFTNAQDLRTHFDASKKEKRSSKKRIKSPTMKQWERDRNRQLIKDLHIDDKEKQQAFNQLYNEYNSNQIKIKRKFKPNKNFDALSDIEAKQQLDQSFQIGKELLQNRKRYADEFQKVMKPQKVLKMFHKEGKMRRQMMKRRDRRLPPRRR